jgi:hypothetical protein
MENNAPIAPSAPTPVAPIPEATPVVAPVTPIEPAPALEVVSTTNQIDNNSIFGKAMPYIIAIGLGIVTSYYFIGIVYYSKALKNSNSIANLQNQLDQLKLAKTQQPT